MRPRAATEWGAVAAKIRQGSKNNQIANNAKASAAAPRFQENETAGNGRLSGWAPAAKSAKASRAAVSALSNSALIPVIGVHSCHGKTGTHPAVS
jgi:hypothetical protein